MDLRIIALVWILFAADGPGEIDGESADPPKPVATGSVRGTLTIELGDERLSLAQLAPAVVHLVAVDEERTFPVPETKPQIHQKDATFRPDFLVVTAGQTVEIPNDDDIFHNVFSYSKPNAFDLGLYAQGTTKSITLEHPGVVKIYCSIHESMNGVIFVASTPFHTRVSADGTYRIEGIPPGDYLAKVWSERLPVQESAITIEAGDATVVDFPITLGTSTPGRSTSRLLDPVPTPGGGAIRPSSSSEEPPKPTPLDLDCCEDDRPGTSP